MAHKQRHKGDVNRQHLYLGGGGLVAAIALVTAVAFGLASAQDMTGGMTGGTGYVAPTYVAPVAPAYVAPAYVAPATGTVDPMHSTATMPPLTPCAAGQVPTATAPCAPSGTQHPSTTTQTGGDCFNSSSASFASQECTQARASQISGTQLPTGTLPPGGQLPPCAAGQVPTATAPCAQSGTQPLPTGPTPPPTGEFPPCAPGVQPTTTNPCRPSDFRQGEGQFPPTGFDQGSQCGPPPFCPFGHKPPTTQPAPGTCPAFECNTPPPGFEKLQGLQKGPQPLYPGFNGPFGRGREGGEGQNGSQCPPGDIFCEQFAGKQDFSKFQFDLGEDAFNKVDERYSERQVQQEASRLKQESKQLKREASEIKDRIERVSNRSGIYCPVVAEYSAALSTIETAVAQWESAKTPEELKTAVALKDQIYGSQDDPTTGVFRKLHGYPDPDTGEYVSGLDQKIGNCEASGHAFRELDQLIKEATKMGERAAAKGLDTAEIEALLDEAEALKANPPADFFDSPDFNKCGGGGFGPPGGGFGPPGGGFGPPGGGFGPPPGFNGGFNGDFGGGFSIPEEDQERMRQFFEEQGLQGSTSSSLVAQRGFPDEGEEGEFEPSEEELACMPGFARYMMGLHKRFGKIMRNMHQGFAEANICGEIDNMIEMSSEFEDKVPAACFNKGVSALTRGKALCKAGDIAGAKKVFFQMQRIQMDPACRGVGLEFEEDEEDGPGFGLDVEALLAQKFAEIEAEIEKRVQERIDDILKKVLDEQAKIIVALEEKISDLVTNLSKVAELNKDASNQFNQYVKAPEDVRDAIVDPVNVIVQVANAGLEALSEKIEIGVAPIVEDYINYVVEHAPTAEVAETLAEQLDAVLTEAKSAENATEAKALVREYVESAEEAIEAVKPEDRIKDGQTSFKDVATKFEEITKQWYFPVLEEAKDRGILSGTKDGEAQANKEMNGAEYLAMVAKGLDIEPKEGATSVEGVNLGNAKWVAPLAAAVDEKLREEGTSLSAVLEGRALDQSLPRIDAAEIVAHVADLPAPEASVVAEVRADATLGASNEAEILAAAAVRDAGIILGKGDDGHFAGGDTMLKVEGGAIISRTQDLTGTGINTAAPESSVGPLGTVGPLGEEE